MRELTGNACEGLRQGREYAHLVLYVSSIALQKDAQGVQRFRLELRDSFDGDDFIIALAHAGSDVDDMIRGGLIRSRDCIKLTDYCMAQSKTGRPVLVLFAADADSSRDLPVQPRTPSPQKGTRIVVGSPRKPDTLEALAQPFDGPRKYLGKGVVVRATVTSMMSFNMEPHSAKKALCRVELRDSSMSRHVSGLFFQANAEEAVKVLRTGGSYTFEVESLQRTKPEFVPKDGEVQLVLRSAVPVAQPQSPERQPQPPSELP